MVKRRDRPHRGGKLTRAGRRTSRRVIYGSVSARILRLMVGVGLFALTLWIVLPVLSSDKGPPSPVGLALSTDGGEELTPARPIPSRLRGIRASPSVLRLTIHASGCSNPVELDGELIRSSGTWVTEQLGQATAPQRAYIALAGVRTERFLVGVDSLEGSGAGQTVIRTHPDHDPIHTVTVHNRALPLLHPGRSTTVASLEARQWAQAKTPLGFRISADLMRPAGFDGCYLAVPELYEFSSGGDTRAYVKAAEALSAATHREGTVPDSIGAAEVEVFVSGRSVVSGSIGEGGQAVATGVRYRCHEFHGESDYPPDVEHSLLPFYVRQGNPNCSGAPLFQAVDIASDTQRRVFFAGIIGAIAATLVIEALFLGQTEASDGSASTRRWRRP
jgi:hypothetical protein